MFAQSRQNAAVRIVTPSSANTPPLEYLDQDKDKDKERARKEQRQCRNVLIHGSCKFEGKGCIYVHPPRPASVASNDSNSIETQPSVNANAPVFVPKSATLTSEPTAQLRPSSAQAPEFKPSMSLSKLTLSEPSSTPKFSEVQNGQPLEEYEYEPHPHEMNMHYESPTHMEIHPEQFYSGIGHDYPRQTLNYHLYTPSKVTPQFLPPSLYMALSSRAEALYHTPPPIGLPPQPEEVSGYHSLIPLEPTGVPNRHKSFGGYNSTVYRAVKANDGGVWCLRRVENFRPPSEHAFSTISTWKKIGCAYIISPVEYFTTRAWGDSSLVLVYPFYPNARPVVAANQAQRGGAGIEESLLWSYIIQLATGIKAVHDHGLAVRALDTLGTKVLTTSEGRLRIGSCGVYDIVSFDPIAYSRGAYTNGPHGPGPEVAFVQQDDLLTLGKLILSLCCPPPIQNGQLHQYQQNLPKAMESITRSYSADLKNAVLWCVSKPGPHKMIGQLFDILAPRLLKEMDAIQTRADTFESHLFTQLENGRLFRMMTKLGFINERPEFDHEPRWSETGDRYIIKLFRDFVFHQVDEQNNPVLDLSHVLSCLNKLDAASEERLILVSRDEQSCLVVSYKDVKSCIEGAYRDLSRTR